MFEILCQNIQSTISFALRAGKVLSFYAIKEISSTKYCVRVLLTNPQTFDWKPKPKAQEML